jgi:hypothetical protein
MKSIRAKQAPHRSPWLPMRVRQEMQTGGRRKSANRPSIERTEPDAAPLTLACAAEAEDCGSRSSSASPIGMETMIRPERLNLKALDAQSP